MAYVIELGNEVLHICENETDKNNCIHPFPPAVAHEISDENFSKLKKNLATASVSGGVLSITEHSEYATDVLCEDQAELKGYIDEIIKKLDRYLKNHSNSENIYSNAQSYYNSLNTLDYSSLTFPFVGTWEKYCEDNSITYLHPLQIL